jgi:hypothetical protein
LPALHPLGHGVSRSLIDVSNTAYRKALMAQQEAMGAHASASGGRKRMHVGSGLNFYVAERGHTFHRRIISARKSESVRLPVQVERTLSYQYPYNIENDANFVAKFLSRYLGRHN